jgi:hypothetical protein
VNPRTSALFVALAAALALVRAAGADEAADADKRFREAFKPIKLPPAAKVEKDVTPSLPQGIVTESGPFDAVIKTLVGPYEKQLAERDDAMAKIGAAADPVADVVLASGVLDAENADLAARVAGVEAMYSEVWDADYMASGEKVHRARKLAAVLIPFYRTLAARNEAVAAAAAEALAKGGDAARTAKLVLAATKDPSPAVRGTAASALGRVGGADALATLAKVRASDASPLVRTKALAALCRFKTSEMKDAVVAALADAAWEVRALAAAICVRGKIVDACGALVAGVEKEDGRLRKDFDDALQALMGVRFYGDVALAKKWWSEHQADVAEKSKALAAGGEYEKSVGPVEAWDQADAETEGADKAKGVTASFFGIATPSRRILFVFDVSFSMNDPAGAKPAAPTGTSKDAYPAPAGNSKMDVARWQLHRAIAALPKDAAFDIVYFSESYKLWQEQMAEATDKTKAKAHEAIDAIKPNGTTNICDSLDKVFEIAGAAPAAARGKAPDLGADTVYLMTDGNPNRGRIVDETKLLESLVAKNHAARLVIHTIGIGEAAGSALLQSLAKRTGGQYVGFK